MMKIRTMDNVTNHSDLIRSAVRAAHADFENRPRRMDRNEFIRDRVREEVGEMDAQEVAVMEAEIQALRCPPPEGPVYRPAHDDERSAALLDGVLTGEERNEVLAHLAASDDDYEAFADTAEVLQAIEDEENTGMTYVMKSAQRRAEDAAEAVDLSALTPAERLNMAVARTQGAVWVEASVDDPEPCLWLMLNGGPVAADGNGLTRFPVRWWGPNYAGDPSAWGALMERERVGVFPFAGGWRALAARDGGGMRTGLQRESVATTPAAAICAAVLAKHGVDTAPHRAVMNAPAPGQRKGDSR